MKKAINRMMSMLKEDAASNQLAEVVFIHGNNEEAARELETHFNQKYPDIKTSISYFGPVIGTHLGEGSLGISWYNEYF